MANEIAQEANQQRHWGILHVDKDSTMIQPIPTTNLTNHTVNKIN